MREGRCSSAVEKKNKQALEVRQGAAHDGVRSTLSEDLVVYSGLKLTVESALKG